MAREVVHYTVKNGNEQFLLQKLAMDILEFGTVVNTSHSVTQNYCSGETRSVENGYTCYEVEGIRGTRYWVHYSGCRVSEIIEDRNI
jgi:hypothetical protein